MRVSNPGEATPPPEVQQPTPPPEIQTPPADVEANTNPGPTRAQILENKAKKKEQDREALQKVREKFIADSTYQSSIPIDAVPVTSAPVNELPTPLPEPPTEANGNEVATPGEPTAKSESAPQPTDTVVDEPTSPEVPNKTDQLIADMGRRIDELERRLADASSQDEKDSLGKERSRIEADTYRAAFGTEPPETTRTKTTKRPDIGPKSKITVNKKAIIQEEPQPPKISDEEHAQNIRDAQKPLEDTRQAYQAAATAAEAQGDTEQQTGTAPPPDMSGVPSLNTNDYFTKLGDVAQSTVDNAGRENRPTSLTRLTRYMQGEGPNPYKNPEPKFDPIRNDLLKAYHAETDPKRRNELLQQLHDYSTPPPEPQPPKITDEEHAQNVVNAQGDLDATRKVYENTAKAAETSGFTEQSASIPPISDLSKIPSLNTDTYFAEIANKAQQTIADAAKENRPTPLSRLRRFFGGKGPNPYKNPERKPDQVRSDLLNSYHAEIDPKRRNEILTQIRENSNPTEPEPQPPKISDEEHAQNIRSAEEPLRNIRTAAQAAESPGDRTQRPEIMQEQKQRVLETLEPQFKEILTQKPAERNAEQMIELAREMSRSIRAVTTDEAEYNRRVVSEVIDKLEDTAGNIPLTDEEANRKMRLLNAASRQMRQELSARKTTSNTSDGQSLKQTAASAAVKMANTVF